MLYKTKYAIKTKIMSIEIKISRSIIGLDFDVNIWLLHIVPWCFSDPLNVRLSPSIKTFVNKGQKGQFIRHKILKNILTNFIEVEWESTRY